MKRAMEKLTLGLLWKILLFSMFWAFVGTVVVVLLVVASLPFIPFFVKLALRRQEKVKQQKNY